jgi:hypothetical protein
MLEIRIILNCNLATAVIIIGIEESNITQTADKVKKPSP